MILTEAEAKELWCPEAGANMRLAGEPAAQARCIGSACMAWRWQADELSGADTEYGFCGKAGKP